MRDFFIHWAERLIGVFVVLLGLMVVAGAIGALMAPDGGLLPALAILLIGGVYALLIGGMFYLFFGIYRNTERTNALLQELLQQRSAKD